ncbi:MAG: hypothetical protein AVDCRST_MAG71-2175 [uncultured Lysobacter sp.]|uniref:Motility protein A N-terminal domain-containing protein n=1 Tax=uncultured Lysobacter sp. TaxID=271060 RepID=A0A6J4LQ07_9GAMM|nr:MAG: hypothetical protein AVDCRST_MAG71-2175 [uncultured Lysobacter sp.]
MLLIVGAVIVLASVLGGFMMVGGKLLALWHLNEIIVICGSAAGAYIISTPPKVMKAAGAAFKRGAHMHRVIVHGHDDHRGVRARAAQFIQRLEAAAAGHGQVEQHRIGQGLARLDHCFIRARGFGHDFDRIE